MFLKLIVLACIAAAAVADRPANVYQAMPLFGGRIIGGHDAKPGEFPWQVSLQIIYEGGKNHHSCGGTILNEQWILTAGHCAQVDASAGEYVVKAGKWNLKEIESTEQVSPVTKKIIHEKYTGGVGPYDIALMKLKEPLKLNDRIKPLAIHLPGYIPSGNAILSGWGAISADRNIPAPNILQTAELPIIDYNDCKNALNRLVGRNNPLAESNICTGPLSGGLAACFGDSGSPLINYESGKPLLMGLASWVITPCGASGTSLSVYTKVPDFTEWILLTMKNN